MHRNPLPLALVSLVFLLALTGCVEVTPAPGETGVFTTDAFSIGYPGDWAAAPCPGASVPVAHAGDLGAEAQVCLSTSEKGTSCIVSFRSAANPAEVSAASRQIYQEGVASRTWRIDSEQPVTVDGRPGWKVIFKKPHGEPLYAVRDVWVPVEGGAYILTCLTYASKYREVNGEQVFLEEIYAPAFEDIMRNSRINQEALPAAATTTPEFPQGQASCEAQGGRWGRIGLSPREECNLPTSDAGKECLFSSECEGLCVAELSREELAAAAHKAIATTGKCSAWRIVVGCMGVVEAGLVRPVCID